MDVQSLPLMEYLSRSGRRIALAALEPTGLRPRHITAIKLLSDHGAMAQHALGELLSLDPSNVVGVLNELEDRGLTVRRRDPADRRRHIVELSKAGETELAAAHALLEKTEDDLLGALTSEERRTLHELLSRAVNEKKPPFAQDRTNPNDLSIA